MEWTKVHHIFQSITEEETSTILPNKEANIQEQNCSKLQLGLQISLTHKENTKIQFVNML